MSLQRMVQWLSAGPGSRGCGLYCRLAVVCGTLACGVVGLALLGRWLLGDAVLPEGVSAMDLALACVAAGGLPLVLGLVASWIRYRGTAGGG